MTHDDDQQPGEGKPGVDVTALTQGRVARAGPWAVGLGKDGEPFAVSRRCRHQLGDLSQGTVAADGCLVCPWHGARYDVRDGKMVQGPRGFLTYHGPTRVYRSLVLAYSRRLPLRRRAARIVGGRVEVE